MGFWSGLTCPPPGIFPAQGSNLSLFDLLHWQVEYLKLQQPGKPIEELLLGSHCALGFWPLLTSFIWESLDLCLQAPCTLAQLGSITTFVTVSLFQQRPHHHLPPSTPQALLRCPLRAGVARASV